MAIDDLSLQDDEVKPSRVDGMAERAIMAQYTKEAHEKAVCKEIESAQRKRTVIELLLFVSFVVALWLALRTWVFPEQIRAAEQSILGLF